MKLALFYPGADRESPLLSLNCKIDMLLMDTTAGNSAFIRPSTRCRTAGLQRDIACSTDWVVAAAYHLIARIRRAFGAHSTCSEWPARPLQRQAT
jgi:hypothetical protein